MGCFARPGYFSHAALQMAGSDLPGRALAQERPLRPAAVERLRAARVERTSRRYVERAGQLAADGIDDRAPGRIEFRRGLEQRRRVGMRRLREQPLRLGQLDDRTEIHDGDAM